VRILLADDDDVFRQRLARALVERGHQVIQAAIGKAALEWTLAEAPEDAVLDLKMPRMNGLEALREMMTARPALAVVILTGYGSIPTAMEAVRLGALDYLIKPTDVERILAVFLDPHGRGHAEAQVDMELPSLEMVEWEHIQRVLADCDQNISEAARTLGLHRRSLQRKLQKYPPPR